MCGSIYHIYLNYGPFKDLTINLNPSCGLVDLCGSESLERVEPTVPSEPNQIEIRPPKESLGSPWQRSEPP